MSIQYFGKAQHGIVGWKYSPNPFDAGSTGRPGEGDVALAPIGVAGGQDDSELGFAATPVEFRHQLRQCLLEHGGAIVRSSGRPVADVDDHVSGFVRVGK